MLVVVVVIVAGVVVIELLFGGGGFSHHRCHAEAQDRWNAKMENDKQKVLRVKADLGVSASGAGPLPRARLWRPS